MTERIVPANHASWDDLRLIFGDASYPFHCQCQRYKMGQAGYAPQPREARAEALRAQTNCGQPDARETSGLVLYLDGEPAGWVAVEPRVNYRIFQINEPTATIWRGRHEDREDEDGHRGSGAGRGPSLTRPTARAMPSAPQNATQANTLTVSLSPAAAPAPSKLRRAPLNSG